MWTRSELKSKARSDVKKNYVACIFAGIILLFALGSQNSVVTVTTNQVNHLEQMRMEAEIQLMSTYLAGPTQVIWNYIEEIFGSISGIMLLVLSIVVFNPIEMGGCRFFLKNRSENPSSIMVFDAFGSSDFKNVVLVLFIRDLFVMLWGLLFVIPGIYKAYEYRMVPYLLAEHPEMTRRDAFGFSKEMMYGQKWNAFVLDFSFILWDILSIMTFGLIGILYVNPYRHATNAELYITLKKIRWGQE